ncbi:MAG: riboflavin biosynthesis protein RibD [Gammaproteobacteria bacterium 28-57-27]|nr:MAG: riboflavin biosynthesis protein RibD [Gammaproteobacteria bacterium 28-57-27]
MARALELARRGLYTTHPNPRVGCVIVREAEIVGEGFHARAGEPHAEIHALRMAGERARGATAYVTLEPCCHWGRTGPCSNALLEAGVTRVVSAMQDPNPRVAGGGHGLLRAAGVQVESGVLEAEARALNAGFIKRMSAGMPRVRVKWGASLDGRTALANGASQWITGAAARRDVQFWRAQSSAILSSAESVITDNARLNVRLTAAELGIEGEVRQPVRVILDRELCLMPELSIFDGQGEVWIYTASNDSVKRTALAAVGAQVYSVPLNAEEHLDLHWILRDLASREINDVWVEAGARLGGAFVAQGLPDELIVYLAPMLLGHTARPLAELPEMTQLNQAQPWQWQEIVHVGDDLRLTLRPAEG